MAILNPGNKQPVTDLSNRNTGKEDQSKLKKKAQNKPKKE